MAETEQDTNETTPTKGFNMISKYAAKDRAQKNGEYDASHIEGQTNLGDREAYKQQRQKFLKQCGNLEIPKHLKHAHNSTAAVTTTRHKGRITQDHKAASALPDISAQGENIYIQSAVHFNPPPFLTLNGKSYKDMPDFNSAHVSLSLLDKGNHFVLQAHLYTGNENSAGTQGWTTHNVNSIPARSVRNLGTKINQWDTSIKNSQNLKYNF